MNIVYQRKIKNIKLIRICFSAECFAANFSQVFSTNVKVFLLNGQLVTRHEIQTFQGFS